jgi:hypothetical protein
MLSRSAEIEVKKLLLQATDLYMGLFDGKPDEYGDNVNEIDYAGYKRLKIEFDGTISEHPKGNTNVIEVIRPPEGFEPRAITHVGIWDAETGGELRLFATIVRKGKPHAQPLGHESTFKLGVNSVQLDFINVADATGCNG